MSQLQQCVRSIIGAIFLAVCVVGVARADSLQVGIAAFNRADYVTAARVFVPLAERGNAKAQFYLGFMYYNGRGVPQSYDEAARWACRAAEQDDAAAQYMVGLMYDKGHGVPEDRILAHKWLNLATSHAPPSDREDWTRIRDAVASKMSLAQLALARALATEWRPTPER